MREGVGWQRADVHQCLHSAKQATTTASIQFLLYVQLKCARWSDAAARPGVQHRQLATLSRIFPGHSAAALEAALGSAGGDVSAAAASLLDRPPSPGKDTDSQSSLAAAGPYT